jgi:acetyltransferase-like isoleucine patch superfamily enzyme
VRTAAGPVPDRIHVPWFLQYPLVTFTYVLCGALIGAGLFPAARLLLWALRRFLLEALLARAIPAAGPLLLFCLFAGVSLFLFFFFGLILTGAAVRLLSLGVGPGRYRAFSPTMVLWSLLNSIHTLAFRIILPIVPAGYFTTMYFRLAGCRLGRDVWLTTAALLDPYLMSIGDGTMVGGDVTISAHLFSRGRLYLAPVRIGRDCEIGAHALICAGATIGDGATVGIRAFIRRGSVVPAGARVEAADTPAAGSNGRSSSLPSQPPLRVPGAAGPRSVSRRGRWSG